VLPPVGTRKAAPLVAGTDPRGAWQVEAPLEDWEVFRIDVMVSGG
jgi:hypothetical protein